MELLTAPRGRMRDARIVTVRPLRRLARGASVNLKPTEKACQHCGACKPLDAFVKRSESPDGHGGHCKACEAARCRRRRQSPTFNPPNRSPESIARNRARAAEYRRERPREHHAWTAVRYAIKVGALMRPATCERCNRGGTIQAHHEDYSRPRDVQWLCARCHRHVHFGLLA